MFFRQGQLCHFPLLASLVFLTEPIQPSAPQIRHVMSIQSADQGDAMAIQVETLHQQKEKYKEQCKAVLAQKESEIAVAKAQIQKEFIPKQAEH